MVHFLLKSVPPILVLLAVAPASARTRPKALPTIEVPALLMDGGRRLIFEGNLSSEREVLGKRSFWTKLKDAVAGEPAYHSMVRPYGIAIDSRGRIIVTDPGSSGVHVFDFARQKYKFLSRPDGDKVLRSPQCVAVDGRDNIYVTDSESGQIFVFGPDGKFQRVIGALEGGEGIFKHPVGIAVDSEAQRIYVSDAWRNKIFVLDMKGSVLETIGKSGRGNGEFNFPTELHLDGQDLIVVDAMNFRVQVLDRSGGFRYALSTQQGADLFRPKGVSADSEGHIYLADAFHNIVQVFDREDHLLYYFGRSSGVGDFDLPGGLAIDSSDRILVVDSYHRRVQMFRYIKSAAPATGAAQ
jgi:DNA-binding beta-propeller fold protein YncE